MVITKRVSKKKRVKVALAPGANGNGKNGAGECLPANPAQQRVTVPALNIQSVVFGLVGTAPLVMNKFSKKAMEEMKDVQKAGSTGKKGKVRKPKDFEALFESAIHYSDEGWAGFPANGMRGALISVCKLPSVGFHMTKAKMTLFVHGNGFDETEGTPLVKITKGKPKYVEHYVRIQQTTDIRVRAMWAPGWEAEVRIDFDADVFTIEDVTNLLTRVGIQVGLCEGRPDSRMGAGMGWGTFRLKGN